MLLILSADPVVGQLVAQQLSSLGLQHRAVDVSVRAGDCDSYFDLAHETGASAVLLIEPLGRAPIGPSSASPESASGSDPALDRLVRAALAAAGAPMAHGFAWVTSRPADDPEIARLRRLGIPYGVLRVPAVFELRLSESLGAAHGSTVLLEADTARALDGTCSVHEVAAQVAGLVEAERHLEGRVETVEPSEAPVERALARRGLEPVPLASWRVGLNAFFGIPVATIGPAPGTVTVARRPFGRRLHGASQAATRDGTPGGGPRAREPMLRAQTA